MFITAVIDRIEDGNAILLEQETGIEICIPLNKLDGEYIEGETITLSFAT